MGGQHAAMLSGLLALSALGWPCASAQEAQRLGVALRPVVVTVVGTPAEPTKVMPSVNAIGGERPADPGALVLGAETGTRPVSNSMAVHGRDRGARCPDGNIPVDTIKQMIEAQAQAQSVDTKLALAIAQRESHFGQTNNSGSGARGPMQLMPGTAARYHVMDICDAAENIKGGIAFLKDLTTEFGGNVFLMLAAYNAGQDRVYQARGVPSNPETVNYVATVANAYYGYDNALQRGKGVPGSASRVVPISDTQGAKGESQGIFPTNQPSTEELSNPWIGGTVFYVNNTGDGN